MHFPKKKKNLNLINIQSRKKLLVEKMWLIEYVDEKPLLSFKFATYFKEGTNHTMKYFQPQIIYDFI